MARPKKETNSTEVKKSGKVLTPKAGDTVAIDAALSPEITFEVRNLEMLDNQIMLGKNTATIISVIETLYNTLVHAVDPEYPAADFLTVYKDKQTSLQNNE